MSTTPDSPSAPPRAKLVAHAAAPSRRAAAGGKSRQRDPFERLYGDGVALSPPHSYAALSRLYDQSDALVAAIGAMETNVAAFGVQFVARREPEGAAQEAEAAAERARLEAFFRFASADLSFSALRRRTRVDLDLFGDAYWEMLRNAKGELVGIEHARTYYFRKCKLSEPMEVPRWKLTAEGAWVRETVWRRFRTYVEWVDGSFQFFKQWGDTRVIHAGTGLEDPSAPADKRASEILNFCHYAPDTPYGKPRWRGTAADIAGRTAAAEVNYGLFDGKAIPPTLITVAGATVTPEVLDRIKKHFASLRGRERYHDPLILEAVPMSENLTGEGPTPQVKIDVKDLTGGIAADGQFSRYRAEAAENVAAVFRLPPIFLGRSKDYNRATAEAARLVAEEQVFAPERREEEEVLNREVLPELGATWWQAKVAGPPLLSEEVLMRLVEVGIKAGVVTPAQVAEILEPLLGHDLTRPEAWAKVPVKFLEALIGGGVLPPEFRKAIDGAASASKPGEGAPAP